MIDLKRSFRRSCELGLALAVVAGGIVASAGVARAEGDECVQLFIDRNQVYADAHYCFKTKDALAYFSNAGCIPGEPRLTRAQEERVAEIQREERRNNCRTR
jgi:hypothetical protein